MKTGIENYYLSRYGLEAGMARMKAHGFDALDYQYFCDTTCELFTVSEREYEQMLLHVRDVAAENGIEISQTHGPWRWPPQDFTEEDRAERFEKMAKSIRGTAILGCENFVIHPIMPFGDDRDPEPERFWQMNYEFMGRLCDVAKEYDITVCFENMPMLALSMSRPADTLRFVKTLNHPNMKVCLDTGHCSVFREQPGDAVRLIGKDYLRVLHVHDNDAAGDRHWLPYTGFIDWEDFNRALHDIGFEGVVSLETSVPPTIPDDLREYWEIGVAAMAKRLAR